MNKIIKSSLAFVLASSFTFSSVGFANENEPNAESFEVIDLQKLSNQMESTDTEMPELIPGDFLYFSKIVLEKMKLAFTFNNVKEAELLAKYSSERLAEAAALYKEGDEQKALEIIQSAIEYIEQSQSIIDEETADQNEASTDKEDADERTKDTAGTEDVVVTEDGEVYSENSYDEIEGTLRNNIAALTAAKAHVGNETAEAALQKNIDKTQVKLANKIKKLENKYNKKKSKNDDQQVADADENDGVKSTDETSESTTGEVTNPAVTSETEEQAVEETATPVKQDADSQKGKAQAKQQENQKETKKVNQEVKQEEKKNADK